MAVQKVIEYGQVQRITDQTLSGTAGPGTVVQQMPGSRVQLNTVSGAPLELLVVLSPDETAAASGQSIANGVALILVRPLPGSVLNVPTEAGSAASGGIPMTPVATGIWKDVTLGSSLKPAVQTQSGINISGITGTASNTAGSGINIDALNISGLSGTTDNAPVDVEFQSDSGTMVSGQITCINKNFKELADQVVTQRALNTVILNDLATLFTQMALVRTDVGVVRTAISGFITLNPTTQAKAVSIAARDANGFAQVRIV